MLTPEIFDAVRRGPVAASRTRTPYCACKMADGSLLFYWEAEEDGLPTNDFLITPEEEVVEVFDTEFGFGGVMWLKTSKGEIEMKCSGGHDDFHLTPEFSIAAIEEVIARAAPRHPAPRDLLERAINAFGYNVPLDVYDLITYTLGKSYELDNAAQEAYDADDEDRGALLAKRYATVHRLWLDLQESQA